MIISWTEAANEAAKNLAGGQGVFHIGIGPMAFDKQSNGGILEVFLATRKSLGEAQQTLAKASPGGSIASPQYFNISLTEGRKDSPATYTELRVTGTRHGVEAVAEVLRDVVDRSVVIRLNSLDNKKSQPNYPDVDALTKAIHHEPARALAA
jgi:hypothetical protein